MRALLIILLTLLAATFLITLTFRGCNSFVSLFDGDNKSKMVNLTKGYYYNKIDKQIWEREEVTGSYKNVYNSPVDSLMWNNKLIVGYSKVGYFVVFMDEKKVKTFETNTSLKKYFLGQFNRLDNIPSLTK